MSIALETCELGKRYRGKWALQNCSLDIPAGRVAALIGPNGAGKTTLLTMAMGLVHPTSGEILVFGAKPGDDPATLARVGFVAQDRPLYRGFTVAEILRFGTNLNPRWDGELALSWLKRLNIPLEQKVSKLSGGQQSQVALMLALAKRPELILLDEPVAALDPLARHEFLQILMDVTAEAGTTVLLSSHLVGELERVCDYLVILNGARVQFAGGLDAFVAGHRVLIGPKSDAEQVSRVRDVLQVTHGNRQTTLVVVFAGQSFDPRWEVRIPELEEIVLAYMGRAVKTTEESK